MMCWRQMLILNLFLKEESDDEMSIEEETVTEVESKKYTHSEAMKALEVANCYARDNNMSVDTLNTINKSN